MTEHSPQAAAPATGITYEQLQAQVLEAATMLIDVWPAMLDGYQGMVAAAMDRGWSEEHARRLVVATLTGTGQ